MPAPPDGRVIHPVAAVADEVGDVGVADIGDDWAAVSDKPRSTILAVANDHLLSCGPECRGWPGRRSSSVFRREEANSPSGFIHSDCR